MKDDLKEIFKNVNDWLKFAETKNGALLGFNSALLFGVLKLFGDNQQLLTEYGLIAYYYNYVLPYCLFISIVFVLVSFLPKTIMVKLNKRKKPKRVNVLFYEHLKTLTAEELLLEVGSRNITNPSNFEKSLAQQIIINSEIASNKFRLFRIAAYFTIGGIILGLPLFLIIRHFVSTMDQKEIN